MTCRCDFRRGLASVPERLHLQQAGASLRIGPRTGDPDEACHRSRGVFVSFSDDMFVRLASQRRRERPSTALGTCSLSLTAAPAIAPIAMRCGSPMARFITRTHHLAYRAASTAPVACGSPSAPVDNRPADTVSYRAITGKAPGAAAPRPRNARGIGKPNAAARA
jgi:hypothetical protein